MRNTSARLNSAQPVTQNAYETVYAPGIEAVTITDPDKEGFVFKQRDNLVGEWKRKYFVLKGESGYIFRDKGEVYPQQKLILRNSVVQVRADK